MNSKIYSCELMPVSLGALLLFTGVNFAFETGR